MENRNRGNNTSNGFWLGLVLGVILTLLFTTKKGREVLNVLLDKGMQKISDLEDKIKESEYMDEDEGDDYVKPEPRQEVRYIAKEEPRKVKEELVVEEVEEDEVVSNAVDDEEKATSSVAMKKDHTEKHVSNGHAANGSSSRFASAKRFFRKAPKKS